MYHNNGMDAKTSTDNTKLIATLRRLGGQSNNVMAWYLERKAQAIRNGTYEGMDVRAAIAKAKGE